MVQNPLGLIAQIVDFLLQLFRQGNAIAVRAIGAGVAFISGFWFNVVEEKKWPVVIMNILAQDVDSLSEIMMLGKFFAELILT